MTDLHVSDRHGTEFASLRKAKLIAPTLSGQLVMAVLGFAGLFFLLLRHTLGLPRVTALLITLPVGALGLVYVLGLITRLSGGRQLNKQAWSAFSKPTTDTRYRLRAVIPERRRSNTLERWALLASGTESEGQSLNDQELQAVEGGFEPLIIRPWLGIKRDANYRKFLLLTMAMLAVIIFVGGWWVVGTALFANTFTIWGLIGIVVGGAAFLSEHAFPAYIRLAPGRLDIFRYRFLGRGEPIVTTHDLREVPLCVDFGSATIALEPPRASGVLAPDLVLSKTWPHFQEHIESAMPEYFSVALSTQREEFCRRLVQAARTTEPTPPLPSDRLLG